MKTLEKQGTNELKRIGWATIIFMVLLFILLAWIANYYKQQEERFVVVKSYGKGSLINLSKNYNGILFPSSEKNYGALLAEKEDILGFNDVSISFDNIKNDSLEINDFGDSLVFVNGKINTLIINNKDNLLPWFQKMKIADIDELETIQFQSKIPAYAIPYLKKIAKHKPTLDLAFEKNDTENTIEKYLQQTPFFNPRFVRLSLDQNQLALLHNFKSVECLYLNLEDSIVTKSLPKLDGLKQCIINGNNLKAIDKTFFHNNKQLEKLSLFGCLSDYSAVQSLDNLSQLILSNNGCKGDLASLENKLPQLTVVLLSGIFDGIDLLVQNQNIKWLGLPDNTSQKQFNTITSQLTNLQILEFKGSDSIKNWASLKQLNNLRGLVITDTLTDTKTLHDLKSLRYLSLPEKKMADSSAVQKLKKSLPGCIIVPNSGACMGSGWLLLLLPTVLMFSTIFPRKLLKKIFKKKNKNESF